MNGSLKVSNAELTPTPKHGSRTYLPPTVDEAGRWYVASFVQRELRLESLGSAPELFQLPSSGVPMYLGIASDSRRYLYCAGTAKAPDDKVFELVRGNGSPQEVSMPQDVFADHIVDVYAHNKFAFAGRGPLEFRRQIQGKHESESEALACVIAPSVSPYVNPAVVWGGRGFIVIYEDGQPKNYRIFVSRVMCNG